MMRNIKAGARQNAVVPFCYDLHDNKFIVQTTRHLFCELLSP
jgi:hypothetical protein